MRAVEQRRRHHEDYPGSFGSAVAVASSTVAAGELYIDTTAGSANPLAGHLGTGANLYLVWNQVPADATAVDVVVHLHGYLAGSPNEAATRTLAGKAGLDLSGRARPTLGIIPRGRQITKTELDAARIKWEAAVVEWEKNGKQGNKPAAPRADRYTFDALTKGKGAGLENLVSYALDHFCTNVLGNVLGGGLRVERVIISAHSGGGAALNRLLGWHATRAICNPHEVHVFDAFYGATDGVTAWVQNRIAEDRALPADQRTEQGGALRIAYTAGAHGTSAGSLKVDNLLRTAAGDALRAAYRADDQTRVGHNPIPRAVGPTLLADARADLTAHAGAHSLAGYGAPVGLMERYSTRPPNAAVVARRPAFAMQAAPIDWCQMRQTIAATARTEERRWTRANGTKYRESHADMRDALRDYWRAVPIAAANIEEYAREAAADNDDYAWSAAFICYVMRTAGVLPAHGFVFGSKHMTYIVGALRNRENSDRNRPFWLVDNVEVQLEAIPEPGDLICMNRQVRNAQGNMVWTTHTTHSLRQTFWGNNGENRHVEPWGSSHCALVIGTWDDPVNGVRYLETIGGNESDSVLIKHEIALSPSAGIGDPQAHHIFGMIRLMGCQP